MTEGMSLAADRTFLALLFAKRAMVFGLAEHGFRVHAALEEVDRQIHQVLEGGDIVHGHGVTKSGEEVGEED